MVGDSNMKLNPQQLEQGTISKNPVMIVTVFFVVLLVVTGALLILSTSSLGSRTSKSPDGNSISMSNAELVESDGINLSSFSREIDPEPDSNDSNLSSSTSPNVPLTTVKEEDVSTSSTDSQTPAPATPDILPAAIDKVINGKNYLIDPDITMGSDRISFRVDVANCENLEIAIWVFMRNTEWKKVAVGDCSQPLKFVQTGLESETSYRMEIQLDDEQIITTRMDMVIN